MNIQKKFSKLTIIVMCLFMGIGCSNNTQPTNTLITNDTIVPTTKEQQAQAFCVSQGFEFSITQTDTGYVFNCVFHDNSECDAFDFLTGECRQDIATIPVVPSSTADVDDIFAGPRFCDPVAEPVCGVNGRTYSNECIAVQQHVMIAHKGTCTETQEPSNPPTVAEPQKNNNSTASNQQNNNSSSGSNSSQTATPVSDYSAQEPIYTNEGIPDWLAVPFSIISDDPAVSDAYIARCPIAGATYYLQVENCDTCFSTLYNNNGDLLCNPTNDVNGSCPAAFQNAKIPSSCSVILQK